MVDVRGDFETARQEVGSEALEQLRQNYFIQARMSGRDDTTVGGLRIKPAGSKGETTQSKSKKNSIADDLLFINMLEQKYGTDFAENWAAELLDEETYNELMKIEDQDERREAIALAIHKGIEDGAIDPEDAYKNTDLRNWMDSHTSKIGDRVQFTDETELNPQASHQEEHGSSQEAGFSNLFDNKI